MRLPWLSLAFFAGVNAQYFSEGWKPGQAVPSDAPNLAPPPAFTPGIRHAPPKQESSPSSKGPFDLSRILSSGPVVSLFEKAGINITDKLSRMKAESPWDPRIPLITDNNYEEVIVKEPLSEQEEQDRTWVLIVQVISQNLKTALCLIYLQFWCTRSPRRSLRAHRQIF